MAERELTCLVDCPHPAAAHGPLDLITGKHGANQVGNNFLNCSEYATDTKPRQRFCRRTEFIPFLSVSKSKPARNARNSVRQQKRNEFRSTKMRLNQSGSYFRPVPEVVGLATAHLGSQRGDRGSPGRA